MLARHWMLLGTSLLAACAGPEPVPSRPEVRIVGSETLTQGLLPSLTATHSKTVGSLDFRLEGGGSGHGLDALLAGETEVAASSRPHLPAEEEQARANGYSLAAPASQHLVGVDVVAVSLHPDRPLDALSYDQVIGIFCTGTITDWSLLGLEDGPIRALARDPSSGTRALFEDFFCGPRGHGDHVEVLSSEEAAQAVVADPTAITYSSLASIPGKVLGLRPDPEAPPVQPSQSNVMNGSYPLYHDLYLYTPGQPSEALQGFLDWVTAPAGQEVVDEARFVPLFLRPDRLDGPRPLRETVHFEAGEATPNTRSRARLRLLVEELRDRAGELRHVVLEGYADAGEQDALALSEARAEAVRELLQEEIPGLYFEIIPRGAGRPLAPNSTPYGRLRNRRVQVYLAEEEARQGPQEDPEAP